MAQGRCFGKQKLPVIVLADDLRSAFNVGSLLRTADGAGVEAVWLAGITPAPPHPNVRKTALGADESVSWRHVFDAAGAVKGLKERGFAVCVLENTAGAQPYYEAEPRWPLCLVVGNEVSGVSSRVAEFGDIFVTIPMHGAKTSLNVAVAAAVVLFHWRAFLQRTSDF